MQIPLKLYQVICKNTKISPNKVLKSEYISKDTVNRKKVPPKVRYCENIVYIGYNIIEDKSLIS